MPRANWPPRSSAPADVYGPGCRPWVLEPLAAIRSGRFLLPNHGEGLFTAIYVDDLVDGILAAATTGAAAGHIIHLGGEEPVSTAEYFGHFYRMLGLDGPPRSYSTRTAIAIAEAARRSLQLAGKPTELGRGVMEMLNKSRPVSNAKAHELLGWAPQVSLADGMAHTEEWLRANGHLDDPGGLTATATPARRRSSTGVLSSMRVHIWSGSLRDRCIRCSKRLTIPVGILTMAR
jgi:nucleoside-diphosphate-sugar epimerase